MYNTLQTIYIVIFQIFMVKKETNQDFLKMIMRLNLK